MLSSFVTEFVAWESDQEIIWASTSRPDLWEFEEEQDDFQQEEEQNPLEDVDLSPRDDYQAEILSCPESQDGFSFWWLILTALGGGATVVLAQMVYVVRKRRKKNNSSYNEPYSFDVWVNP